MLWLTFTYFAAIFVLALYGVHRLYLVLQTFRKKDAQKFNLNFEWPEVCVQLPIYNEQRVAERLLRAIAGLRYPAGKFEIQVLDDSTDETSLIIDAVVNEIQADGVACRVLRREHRTGYKAGALKRGLYEIQADYVAIFDADFVPHPDFLQQAMPAFFQEENIGFVQARWSHLNRSSNILTRAQAVMLDSHFYIEHFARYLLGCCFNFNGTAGIWRKQAILEAGNWEGDTLTEDLDLSYRAYLRGWRGEYLVDVDCPAELPETLSAYKSQQRRWSKGSVQVLRKLFLRILTSTNLSFKAKAEAFFHLTSHFCYLLLLFITLSAMPVAVWRMKYSFLPGVWFEPLVFAITIGSLFLFFAVAMFRNSEVRLSDIMAAFFVGIGISAHCSLAALSGLFRPQGGVFERTPKTGNVISSGGSSMNRFRNKLSARSAWPGVFAHPREFLIFIYLASAGIVSFLYSAYLVIPFILLLTAGYTTVLWCGTVSASHRSTS